MNRHYVAGGLLFALGLAGVAHAQPAADPVVWTWLAPLGNTASDSRFRGMIQYSIDWGFYPNDTANPSSSGAPLGPRNRDGTTVGAALATEVMRRNQTHTALLLRNVGFKNLFPPPINLSTYGDYTALYDYHVSSSDTDRVMVGTSGMRFIWMTKGIAQTAAWTDALLAQYETTCGNSSTYAPERIAFDQEISSFMINSSWSDLLALWNFVSTPGNDSRWSTEPVPGFGTQTLSDLWTAAQLAGITTPGADTGYWGYHGGTAANQAWWEWLFAIEQTATASALDKAFYSRVAARGGIWANVKCSDYEGTMRSDGLADDYPGYPANTDSASSGPTLLGPVGTRYAQNCSGTNIVQAPHLYTDCAFYGWSWFNLATLGSSERWRNTDDQHTPNYGRPGPRDTSGTPLVGEEFWSETSKRQWRFKLDACSKSFDGANIPIDAWVTLPNQPMFMLGAGNIPHPGTYDGLSYSRNEMACRQSFRSTVDSLAAAKNHRVNRLLVWNDTNGYQPGPHAQFTNNWNYFQRALDLVWGINVTEFRVDTSVNSLPQGYSQSTRVDKVAYADGSVTTDATNRLKVLTNSNAGMWTVTHFQLGSGLASSPPKSLNFSADVIIDQNVRIWPYIYDWSGTGSWHQIGTSAGTGVADLDGRSYPVTAAANKTMRLTMSIPYSGDYVSPSSSGNTNTIFLAIFCSPDVGGVMTGYFDMVQCYGGEDTDDSRWRSLGDMNGDYVVDGLDATMADDLFTNYANYLSWSGSGTNPYEAYKGMAPWIDFNRDGVVNSADETLWSDNFKAQTKKVDDFKRTSVDSR